MKKIIALAVMLLTIMPTLQAQTSPHWGQIKGRPMRCVTEFNAKGDGVTDDTAAIQLAVDSSPVVWMPPGVYLVSSPIVITNRRGLIGAGQGTVATSLTRSTTILYNGGTATNTAVISLSTGAIGVPGDGAGNSNVTLSNITIDANGKAGYAVWADYLYDESLLENIVVKGATVHGISVNGNTYYNKFHKITAYKNAGVGIYIGDKANANQFIDLRAQGNGSDISGPPEDNAGIHLLARNQNNFLGIVSEANKGPGVILEFTGPGNQVNGLYLETNNIGAADPVGALVIPRTSARYQTIRGLFLAATPGGTSHQHMITSGTEVGSGYIIEYPSQQGFGESIIDSNNLLTIVHSSPLLEGNISPKGSFAVGGRIYSNLGFVANGTSGQVDRGKQRWETGAAGVYYNRAWTASPTVIATFSVIQPTNDLAVNAVYDFALGYNEFTAATRQAHATARGAVIISRGGRFGSTTTVASHSIALSLGSDTGGGDCSILSEEITFVLSGDATGTQTLTMMFSRSNNNFTPVQQSLTLNGTLTNASCGTGNQGVTISY